MKLKRLSADDFDRLAAETRVKDRARDMARAVLVEGRAQADVAMEHGMSKQRVNLAVGAIERAYFKSAAPGTGRVEVTLDMPEALALELSELIDGLKQCTDQERSAKALSQVLRSMATATHSLE